MLYSSPCGVRLFYVVRSTPRKSEALNDVDSDRHPLPWQRVTGKRFDSEAKEAKRIVWGRR